ncbi:MAG: hypothetical protein ABIA93_00875 [Candidatus Woesearchaeota archaeon]
MPIDVLPIHLLSSFLEDYTIIVVDEFQRMNGTPEHLVRKGKEALIESFEAFSRIYGFDPKIQACSSFMGSPEYKAIYEETRKMVLGTQEEEDLLRTVPESKRHIPNAREYPFHEVACVRYLEKKGFRLKIGPPQEKQYDSVMSRIGFSISFAYILEAYALGTRSTDSVVHYLPSSKGPNNGQRIYLHEDENKARQKVMQGCDIALKYVCRIASASGALLGQRHLEEEEIDSMHGRHLKKEAERLLLHNIVRPYKEVLQ